MYVYIWKQILRYDTYIRIYMYTYMSIYVYMYMHMHIHTCAQMEGRTFMTVLQALWKPSDAHHIQNLTLAKRAKRATDRFNGEYERERYKPLPIRYQNLQSRHGTSRNMQQHQNKTKDMRTDICQGCHFDLLTYTWHMTDRVRWVVHGVQDNVLDSWIFWAPDDHPYHLGGEWT